MTTTPTIDKNVQIFIDTQFPEYFREEAGTLVTFVKYYYEWLASEGQAVGEGRDLIHYRDSATTAADFLTFLHDEFLENLPRDIAADERLVMRHILDFYRAKGSERAFRLLFRILYGEEIEFYYPGDDILRASDGRWTVERRLVVNVAVDDPMTYPQIVGGTSGATAIIDRIDTQTTIGGDVTSMYVSSVYGTFVKGESILENQVGGRTLATITSEGLLEDSGRWIGTEGFISSDKYLQDNWYYQEYSYVIKTTKNVNDWRKPIYKLAHPSGSKLFGCVTEQIVIDASPELEINVDVTHQALVYTVLVSAAGTTVSTSITFPYKISISFTEDLTVTVASSLRHSSPVAGTGTVHTSSDTIADLTDPISTWGVVPLGLLGSPNILFGTGTIFETELEADALIAISDVPHSANGVYVVSSVYSDTAMRIAPEYAWVALSDSNFTIDPTI